VNRREIFYALAGMLGAAAWSRASVAQTLPQRRAASAPPPGPVNLLEFEPLAQKRLSRMVYDYIAGGAADEHTLRRNRGAYDKILLQPRALIDVSRLDTSVSLFGQRLEFPILLAPTAYHKLVHAEGERATARGAGAAGATLVISSFATVAVEEIAQAAKSPLWFQLYVQRDRAFTRDLVQRAEAAGCRALCVTVDTPVLGTRDYEKRSRFNLPPGIERENLKGLGRSAQRAPHQSEGAIYSEILDATLTWDAIDWIRSFAKVPVILKGILAPEDARLAAGSGAAGIIVSNHGARNLDTTPSTIEALPRVMEAVDGRMPVLLDGGIRRGTDVVKALALGAKAILIGRPYLWGLAVAGGDGVQQVVEILRNEFAAAMALCGATRLEEINRHVIWPHS
jgi:4-hydroxymandelate oxidase